MIMTEPAGSPASRAPRLSKETLNTLRDDYLENGVVRIANFLPIEWVDALLRVVTDARRRESAGEQMGAIKLNKFPGKATIHWLSREYDVARRFFTESGVQDTVAAVIGATRLQYWFDNTFIHEFGTDAQGSQWHHDIAAFPFAGEQIPSVWIALTDVPLNLSPLQMIKGSHRNRTQFRPPVYVDPNATMPDGYEELPDVAAKVASGEFEVLQSPMKKGDAYIIHPYTLHGSPPTEVEDVTRVAFTTRWAGDDVVWKPDIFSMRIAGIDYAKLPVGQRPEGELFPYVELAR